MAAPPSFLQSLPTETDTTDGDIVTFQVKVSNDPSDPTIVSWWRCGEPLRPIQGRRDIISHEDGWHELILSNITDDDEGEYECRAENNRGHNSCFGSLYYYHEGAGGTLTDVTMEGTVGEGDGRQSGLLILIDDGSQTEESGSEKSNRRSMTVSEQMQGIIEDLTQSTQGENTGSLTLEKDDDQFNSDIEDLNDDDLENNMIQTILGMGVQKTASEDTLVPEMPSPDLLVDVAVSEGAQDPYAPSTATRHQKWSSNPNQIQKKKKSKGTKEQKDEVIWPPEAALVTFDLPAADTVTTSVELPFAKITSTEDDDALKSSARGMGVETPFDVADITEEAVDDGAITEQTAADSPFKSAALQECALPHVESHIDSRIERDSSLTSVTDISGAAAIPSEGCQQSSRMSFVKTSVKSATYKHTDDGVMSTTASISSRVSSTTMDTSATAVHHQSKVTRTAGEMEEEESVSVSYMAKKSKMSSAYEADESSTSINRSIVYSDSFLTDVVTEHKFSFLISPANMFSINNALLMLDKKLQEENKFNEYLIKVEKSTGIERRKLVLGSCFLLGAMVIIGYGAQLICNGIGFAYPAYSSILAIESRNKEDDTLWLTYWVVFAALCLVEFFSDFILALIPFYWMLKSIFLIWCFLPYRLNGSKFLYYRFIRPVFLSHLGEPETENSPSEEKEKSS